MAVLKEVRFGIVSLTGLKGSIFIDSLLALGDLDRRMGVGRSGCIKVLVVILFFILQDLFDNFQAVSVIGSDDFLAMSGFYCE